MKCFPLSPSPGILLYLILMLLNLLSFCLHLLAYLVSTVLFFILSGFCSFSKPVFHFLSFNRPTNLTLVTFVMMTLGP